MAARGTEWVFLQGKVKWFRPDHANEWGKWSHVLYLNDESLKKFRDLQMSEDGVEGIKNDIKQDEDGYFVTLSRPTSKMYKGVLTAFTNPQVLDKDGIPTNVKVGNGSDITTKIEVYKYRLPTGRDKWGKAIRWLSSRIDNLVPFQPTSDFTDREQKIVGKLAEQPEQMF